MKTYEEIVSHYKNLNLSEDETTYEQMLELYEFAELMLDAIEAEGVRNTEEQFLIAKPAIKQVEETAEILCEKFLDYIEEGKKSPEKYSKEMETAVRKFFAAMDKFNEAIREMAKG